MPTKLLWNKTDFAVSPESARKVMACIGSIGVYRSGQRFAWRGLASADFDLSSSLHRTIRDRTTTPVAEKQMRAEELAILAQARTWRLGQTLTGPVNDLQLLAELQHFGIRTRLIDVTSNPMTALWFACQPSPAGSAKAGVLVALNTSGWTPYESVGSEWAAPTYGGQKQPTAITLITALATGKPFIVNPSTPNDRMRAQEGYFVASSTPAVITSPFADLTLDKAPPPATLLDDLLGDRGRGGPRSLPYVAIIIRSNLKAKLLNFLEHTYNRTAAVLFPDYLGFKDYGLD
jgi:hypothetical protein